MFLYGGYNQKWGICSCAHWANWSYVAAPGRDLPGSRSVRTKGLLLFIFLVALSRQIFKIPLPCSVFTLLHEFLFKFLQYLSIIISLHHCYLLNPLDLV